MRAVVQRVTSAAVEIDGEQIAGIGPGLCALVGIAQVDDDGIVDRMAEKLWNLRIFQDEQARTNRSIAELGGHLLIVSQFTLYADTSRGRRPSFLAAARPKEAERLIELLVKRLWERGAYVQTGRFAAHMHVTLTNDGPFTVMLEV